jgi:hypothetical protein
VKKRGKTRREETERKQIKDISKHNHNLLFHFTYHNVTDVLFNINFLDQIVEKPEQLSSIKLFRNFVSIFFIFFTIISTFKKFNRDWWSCFALVVVAIIMLWEYIIATVRAMRERDDGTVVLGISE